MSWEEPRKIKCPICNVDMELESARLDKKLTFKFKCPKCGLTTTLYFDRAQIIKTVLAKIGYEEVEVKAEKGEESEAEG